MKIPMGRTLLCTSMSQSFIHSFTRLLRPAIGADVMMVSQTLDCACLISTSLITCRPEWMIPWIYWHEFYVTWILFRSYFIAFIYYT